MIAKIWPALNRGNQFSSILARMLYFSRKWVLKKIHTQRLELYPICNDKSDLKLVATLHLSLINY